MPSVHSLPLLLIMMLMKIHTCPWRRGVHLAFLKEGNSLPEIGHLKLKESFSGAHQEEPLTIFWIDINLPHKVIGRKKFLIFLRISLFQNLFLEFFWLIFTHKWKQGDCYTVHRQTQVQLAQLFSCLVCVSIHRIRPQIAMKKWENSRFGGNWREQTSSLTKHSYCFTEHSVFSPAYWHDKASP